MNVSKLTTFLGVPLGLFLTTVASAQVVEESQPRPADRPVASGEEPAVVTGAERSQESQNVTRRVSEVLSGEARGPGDEGRIAAISDLIMDAQGRPHYILLSRGGVAGLGGDVIAVPFSHSHLIYVEDRGWHLQLPMTGERLEQAPTLEEGSLAPLRNQSWVQANNQFFEAILAERPANEQGTGDDTFLFRASALKGAEVQGSARDESIASVDDVLLDADYRASYAILGYGGIVGLGEDQVPVPFDMLRLSSKVEDDHYRLIVGSALTKERLQSDSAPKLENEYNRMLDSAFVERIHSYFAPERTETIPADKPVTQQ